MQQLVSGRPSMQCVEQRDCRGEEHKHMREEGHRAGGGRTGSGLQLGHAAACSWGHAAACCERDKKNYWLTSPGRTNAL